jgi:hypothetical protein
MKTVLLRKIRQKYDYFWHITPGTNWTSEETRIRVFNKKTNRIDVYYSVESFISDYIENANMDIITRTIFNNIKEKHDDKRKIIDWNKQKKTLAELSTNLTIKQVINPKNVKCIKLKEQKINLFAGTSNSVVLGSNMYTTSNTLTNNSNYVQNTPTPYNGFVTVTHSKSGTSMLTYP